ncbi:MAG: hypothetical protein EZS28_019794, partial [Streblomastix strix]
ASLLFVVLSALALGFHTMPKSFFESSANQQYGPPLDPDSVQWYPDGKTESDGSITYEWTELNPEKDIPFSYKKISDYKVLAGGKTSKASFSAVAKDKEEFDKLSTSKALNTTELGCDAVGLSHLSGIYGYIGYAVKAYGKDIAPSITQLLKDSPPKVTMKWPKEEGQDFDEVLSIGKTCTDGEAYYFNWALKKSGVVDSACIPNSGIPTDTSKCAGEAGKFQPQLKGYVQGTIHEANTVRIKDALIHFGVVNVNEGAVQRDLLIGWDGSDWIAARELVDSEQRGLFSYAYVKVPINESKVYDEVNVIVNKVSSIRAALSFIFAAILIPELSFFF